MESVLTRNNRNCLISLDIAVLLKVVGMIAAAAWGLRNQLILGGE